MSDRGGAVLNLAVFAPLAWYGLTGRRPPDALLIASAGVLLVNVLRDLETVTGAPVAAAGAAPAPRGA